MGIDVGVARIEYNYNPQPGPALEFVKFLMEHEYEADWWMGAGGNMLVEYSHDTIRSMVDRYVDSHGLGDGDRTRVLSWVSGLPWNSDTETVMLHLAW